MGDTEAGFSTTFSGEGEAKVRIEEGGEVRYVTVEPILDDFMKEHSLTPWEKVCGRVSEGTKQKGQLEGYNLVPAFPLQYSFSWREMLDPMLFSLDWIGTECGRNCANQDTFTWIAIFKALKEWGYQRREDNPVSYSLLARMLSAPREEIVFKIKAWDKFSAQWVAEQILHWMGDPDEAPTLEGSVDMYSSTRMVRESSIRREYEKGYELLVEEWRSRAPGVRCVT